ncbi:MAG: type II CRISPR RNA-guided endonuclease Cas9, partial [Candidatus Methylumidiphilus sp.]
MRYRLALDLGTASIGLAAYALNELGEPIAIPHHAVRIFPEPLQAAKNQGVGEPKKAARRVARLARRQIDRKARRLRRIAQCLPLLGLDTKDLAPDSGQNIHRLRADAATQGIELADFARVLLKMSKRRGYYGAFRSDKKAEPTDTDKKGKSKEAQKQDKEDKKNDKAVVKPGIEKLKEEMAKCGVETLGQYLAYRYDNNLSLKLAPEDSEVKLYVHRDLLEAEFERLWTMQAQFHPILNGNQTTGGNGESIKGIFHQALFFQRPLKSPAAMVGRCPLEKDLPRAPMAQPAAQAFRMEKQLADLRWGMGQRAKALSSEQKTVIRELLHNQATVTFQAIYAALEQADCPRELGRGLNMDRSSREELTGDKTRAALRSAKINLLEPWDALDRNTQVQVINFLADLGSPEQLYDQHWHAQFFKKVRAGKDAKGEWLHQDKQREFSADFIGFINKIKESAGYGRLAPMGFDSGRSAYSVKALEKLTQHMREDNPDGPIDERKAIEKAYPDYYAEKPPLTELPPPPLTGNTVVDVALHQVELEIRKAIKQLGGLPSEIIVELARDMALGVKRRNDIEDENTKNKNLRKKAAGELQKEGLPDSKTNIFRYLLWEEQDKRCPYCGDGLLSLNEVVDGNATHIDHILPRSLTQVGRKRDQSVLAHIACNHAKGDNTPWEAWGGDPPKNPKRWEAVQDQARRFRDKKHHRKLEGKARLLELEDFDDETVKGFSDRQFQETAWIAKLTAQWLRNICPPGEVHVSRGQMTAHFRRIWHLETVIPQVRFEDKLPVFDTDGEPISQEDFDQHRSFWEGRDHQEEVERTDRGMDKRLDHRHHLIDALVIGLCTPSLYQRMANEYKQKAERKKHGEQVKLRLSVEPPFHDLRNKALDLVRHCNLTHKHDRFPDGPLFKETAYGMAEVLPDGKIRLGLKPPSLTGGGEPPGNAVELSSKAPSPNGGGLGWGRVKSETSLPVNRPRPKLPSWAGRSVLAALPPPWSPIAICSRISSSARSGGRVSAWRNNNTSPVAKSAP